MSNTNKEEDEKEKCNDRDDKKRRKGRKGVAKIEGRKRMDKEERT